LLLLLRGDLKESDIPKRTKIRELVIKSWKRYMEVLKVDLAVSLHVTHPDLAAQHLILNLK
jgi:hypothetical protein